jgi:hypothetical protein
MAMTSSSRSRPMNTESRARASSTATPALSESWTRIWWSMRWVAAHAPRLSRQPGLRSTGRRALGGQRELRRSIDANSGGIVNEKMAFVVPEPERSTGGAFSMYEHDRWIFTVTRLAQNEPPGDLATMIRMATQLRRLRC